MPRAYTQKQVTFGSARLPLVHRIGDSGLLAMQFTNASTNGCWTVLTILLFSILN
jgi:hypothetical protein